MRRARDPTKERAYLVELEVNGECSLRDVLQSGENIDVNVHQLGDWGVSVQKLDDMCERVSVEEKSTNHSIK